MNVLKRIIISTADKIKLSDKKRNRLKKYKEYKELFDKNKELNNSHSGRCFIFGNGPSIKNVDFGKFDNEDVFVVNMIANHAQFKKLKPKYYIVMDPFLLSSEQTNKDRIEKIIEVGKNNPDVRYFLPIEVKDNYYCDIIKKHSEILFLKPFLRMADYINDDPSLTKTIPNYGNVVLYAIYIAICLGYKEIYLLGCDETNIITIINAQRGFVDDSSYGYYLSEEAKKKIIEDCTKLPFERSLYQITEMFNDFALLKQYGEKYGVKIYNCSKDSLVKCYECIPLEEVL